MRSGISFTLSTSDRLRLEARVADRNTPQKHVWRARIVLLSADGLGTHAIMRAAGVSKTVVWRWQDRFSQEGVDGLLRDKTRPARIPPLGPEVAARGGSDARRTTRRDHALDGRRHEQGCGWDCPCFVDTENAFA
ncbi:helix-turn-helix domain-containing protein [Methylobacterium sp. HMF5984]|uniref:helix-turn-helix domain-containing protein n=1 Tax=Methylobacterium sp. HMF5984 TaxID=3367370 RepID=UPI0038547827